jgi:iron only hydrogenase large subunit-like protein/nitrogen-specific signal transduction histidine kinase
MTKKKDNILVFTIKDRCRVCYTCVRECPVKAIKFINGQAEIISERCIACGNCTRVCSQGAKAFINTTHRVEEFLLEEKPVFAMIAPSFIAEFEEIKDYRILIGMLKNLGFSKVFEVAFGADLVASEYRRLIHKKGVKGIISSDCPAIVSFIEKHNPELVGNLAPIASPMVAMARYLRFKHGNDFNLVFIGPCIAKKAESTEIDEQITFIELRELFMRRNISEKGIKPVNFDPPKGGKGAIFPISRGLLQTVNLLDDDLERTVIVTEGKANFQEAIREYKTGALSGENLELLCCEGCIMGPGTSRNGKKFSRRSRVMEYVSGKINDIDFAEWNKAINESIKIDLSQTFEVNDQSMSEPAEDEIIQVLKSMNKFSEKDHLNCGACGYDTCRNHSIAIIKGLAETEMCLPYTIDKLHNSIEELAVSNEKLHSIQQTLKQTEKLAHMGQLSAGIAHELNNPLGVVIMYSNLLLDDSEEGSPLKEDLKMIVEQAERCKVIVGGLLNFARKNQVNYREVDINELIRVSVSSVIIPANVSVEVNTNIRDPFAEMDKEQMIQVVSNLIKNGIEAMPRGGKIILTTADNDTQVILKIKDSGTGIHVSDLEKVFEPFFTTKGIGKGTGLGLATAYGVVKMHKGRISVQSNADPSKGPTGTEFTIHLPKRINFK